MYICIYTHTYTYICMYICVCRSATRRPVGGRVEAALGNHAGAAAAGLLGQDVREVELPRRLRRPEGHLVAAHHNQGAIA